MPSRITSAITSSAIVNGSRDSAWVAVGTLVAQRPYRDPSSTAPLACLRHDLGEGGEILARAPAI